MEDADRCLGTLFETPGKLLGKHDGAVIAARATERDNQAGLALRAIRRERELEKLHDELQEAVSTWLSEYVLADRCLQAGEALEVRDPVGIREESHVEDEVGF